MNNDSIAELTIRLQKALDSNYDVIDMQTVLFVISQLEGATITKEQLETTRLAKYINQLRRRTSSEQLARQAKSLLKRWREMVIPTITSQHQTTTASNMTTAQISSRPGTLTSNSFHLHHASVSQPTSPVIQPNDVQYSQFYPGQIRHDNASLPNYPSASSNISKNVTNKKQIQHPTISSGGRHHRNSVAMHTGASLHAPMIRGKLNSSKLMKNTSQFKKQPISFANLIETNSKVHNSAGPSFMIEDTRSQSPSMPLSRIPKIQHERQSPMIIEHSVSPLDLDQSSNPSHEGSSAPPSVIGPPLLAIVNNNNSNNNNTISSCSRLVNGISPGTSIDAQDTNSNLTANMVGALVDVQQIVENCSSEHRKSKKHKKDKKRKKQNNTGVSKPALHGVHTIPSCTSDPILSDETQICESTVFPSQENLSLSNSSLSMFPNASIHTNITENSKGVASIAQKCDNELTFAGKFTNTPLLNRSELSGIGNQISSVIENGKVLLNDVDTTYPIVISGIKKPTQKQKNISSIMVVESRSCSPFTPIGGNSNDSSTTSSHVSNIVDIPNLDIHTIDQHRQSQSQLQTSRMVDNDHYLQVLLQQHHQQQGRLMQSDEAKAQKKNDSSTTSSHVSNIVNIPNLDIHTVDEHRQYQNQLQNSKLVQGNHFLQVLLQKHHQQQGGSIQSDEIKTPKKRGRKKGSKGVDGVLAQHCHIFENSKLLSFASLSGNKKVKTTKELLADIQSRKLESAISSPTMQSQSRPPSTCSEPSLQSQPSTSDACSTPATMSTVARSTPDQQIVSTSNLRPLDANDESSDSTQTLKKSSQLVDIDVNSVKIKNIETLTTSIDDEIKLLLSKLPKLNRFEIMQNIDDEPVCTCTLREVQEDQVQVIHKMDEIDNIQETIELSTKSIQLDAPSKVQSPLFKQVLTPFKPKLPPKAPIKSIFDLDYDEDNDPIHSFVEAIKSNDTEYIDNNNMKEESLKENNATLNTANSASLVATGDIKLNETWSQPNQTNIPWPVPSSTVTTAINNNNNNLNNNNNNNNSLVEPVMSKPREIFPRYEIIEDVNCLAKQRYEIQTNHITEFHIDKLHNRFIPNVNGNWDDSTPNNIDDGDKTLLKSLNGELKFDGLYERVVPQYNQIIMDRIPKDLSHIQFTRDYNKRKNNIKRELKRKRNNSVSSSSTIIEDVQCKKSSILNDETIIKVDVVESSLSPKKDNVKSEFNIKNDINSKICTNELVNENSNYMIDGEVIFDSKELNNGCIDSGSDHDVEITDVCEISSSTADKNILNSYTPIESISEISKNDYIENNCINGGSPNNDNDSISSTSNLVNHNHKDYINKSNSKIDKIGEENDDNNSGEVEIYSNGFSNCSDDHDHDNDNDHEYDEDYDEDEEDSAGDFLEVVTRDMPSTLISGHKHIILTIKKAPNKLTPQSSPLQVSSLSSTTTTTVDAIITTLSTTTTTSTSPIKATSSNTSISSLSSLSSTLANGLLNTSEENELNISNDDITSTDIVIMNESDKTVNENINNKNEDALVMLSDNDICYNINKDLTDYGSITSDVLLPAECNSIPKDSCSSLLHNKNTSNDYNCDNIRYEGQEDNDDGECDADGDGDINMKSISSPTNTNINTLSKMFHISSVLSNKEYELKNNNSDNDNNEQEQEQEQEQQKQQENKNNNEQEQQLLKRSCSDTDINKSELESSNENNDTDNDKDILPTDNNYLLHSFNNLTDECRTGIHIGDDGKLRHFKEWHEVLQVRSYNDELLTILPYVVID